MQDPRDAPSLRFVRRLASPLLALLVLAGAAAAQERVFDGRDPGRWRALAARACALDPAGRAVLVLEGRRVLASPDARAACQRAVDHHAARRPSGGDAGAEERLLRALLAPPAVVAPGLASGDEVEADAAAAERGRAIRAALDRLAVGLSDLGLPDPAAHPRVRVGRTLGWLVGEEGDTVWLVTDAPALRSVSAPGGWVRVDPLDEALDGALRLRKQTQPARRWRGRDVDRSDVERVRLAWSADRLGRPELAALLLGLDDEPGRDVQAALDVAAMTSLRGEVTAAWERCAPPGHVRELLAPILRQASGRTLRVARAFEDGLLLLEADAGDWRAPTALEWSALGLEERLEALAAAARAGALEQPFPADAAPPSPSERPARSSGRWSDRSTNVAGGDRAGGSLPTARDRLADLGWDALPILVELLEDRRPVRGVRAPSCCDEDDRPYATVGDVCARLLGRYVGFGTCARQRRGVESWWAQWSEEGPAAWWASRLRAAPPRSYAALEARAEADLGWRPRGVLAGRVHTATGDAERAAWLAVAADLREPTLADAFARAAEEGPLPVAVVGVRGLAALSDPRAAAAAAGLARTPDLARQPAAVEALAALRAARFPSTVELTRALAAAPPKGRALALSTVLRPDDLDDRLALLVLGSAPGASTPWSDYESRRRPDGSIQRATSLRRGIAADLLKAQRLALPPSAAPEAATLTFQEAAATPRSVALEPDLGPVAVAMLTSDVADWRDDPVRRDQAVAVAVRLGAGVVAALGSETGVDLRAALSEGLLDPGRAGPLATAADEAGPWVRDWLAEVDDGRAALALDRTPRGPLLPCAALELDPGVPAALREAAAGWVERGGVDAPTLVLALRTWAASEADDAPPGVLLRLRRDADGGASLRLSPLTGPGEPGLVFEVRSGMLERTWWRRPPGASAAEAAQAGFGQLLAPFVADPGAPVEVLVRAWR